eukprot:m.36070 g.36070  ORF g.36070 m.36070 type:complete len:578 (-) comp14444_c0_seq1:35-1768(-)
MNGFNRKMIKLLRSRWRTDSMSNRSLHGQSFTTFKAAIFAITTLLRFNSPVAGEEYVLAGLPVNMTGCCRFYPENPSNNVVYMDTAPNSCRSKCDIDESCVAYETVAFQEKCELHYALPDYTNTDAACRCWVKAPTTTSSLTVTFSSSVTSTTSTTISSSSATTVSTTSATTSTTSTQLRTTQITTTESVSTTSTSVSMVIESSDTSSQVKGTSETAQGHPKPSLDKLLTTSTMIPTIPQDVIKHWSKRTTIFTVICVLFSCVALVVIAIVVQLNRNSTKLRFQEGNKGNIPISEGTSKATSRIHTWNIAFGDESGDEKDIKHTRESATDCVGNAMIGTNDGNAYHHWIPTQESKTTDFALGRPPKRCDSNPYSVFHTAPCTSDYEEPVPCSDTSNVYNANGFKMFGSITSYASPAPYDKSVAYEEPVPLVTTRGCNAKHVVAIIIPETLVEGGENDYADPNTPYDASSSVFHELLDPQPSADIRCTPSETHECHQPAHSQRGSCNAIGTPHNCNRSMKSRFRSWLRTKADTYDIIPRARSENYDAVALPPAADFPSLKENAYDNPRAVHTLRQRSM